MDFDPFEPDPRAEKREVLAVVGAWLAVCLFLYGLLYFFCALQ